MYLMKTVLLLSGPREKEVASSLLGGSNLNHIVYSGVRRTRYREVTSVVVPGSRYQGVPLSLRCSTESRDSHGQLDPFLCPVGTWIFRI